MHNDEPRVDSFPDLHTLCEVFHVEDGQLEFSHVTFSFIDTDDAVYFGQSSVTKQALNTNDINEGLKHVPDEDIYPKPPSHVTAVTTPIIDDFYIKCPKLTSYDAAEGTGLLPKLLLQEAEILEFISRNPHPNLVRYHGCVLNVLELSGSYWTDTPQHWQIG